MPTRADIVKAARAWEGTPFRHQGRGPNYLDCAGLLVVVAAQVGIHTENPKGYKRLPDGVTVNTIMSRNLKRIRNTDIQPGDVVQLEDRQYVCHMGIVTDLNGELGLIHAYGKVGVMKVVEHTLDDEWRSRITGAFSFKGI